MRRIHIPNPNRFKQSTHGSFSKVNAALTASQTLDESQQNELIGIMHKSFDNITTGDKPTANDLLALKVGFEVAAQIADKQSVNGQCALDVIENGLRSLMICKAASLLNGGVIRFTGDDMRTVSTAIELHDDIVRVATCGNFRKATKFLKTHEYRPSFELAKVA